MCLDVETLKNLSLFIFVIPVYPRAALGCGNSVKHMIRHGCMTTISFLLCPFSLHLSTGEYDPDEEQAPNASHTHQFFSKYVSIVYH